MSKTKDDCQNAIEMLAMTYSGLQAGQTTSLHYQYQYHNTQNSNNFNQKAGVITVQVTGANTVKITNIDPPTNANAALQVVSQAVKPMANFNDRPVTVVNAHLV